MSKKNLPKLSQETVSNSLMVGTPAQTSMDITTAQQPFPGLFMNLPVAEVEFFDKNPRKRHDPETYHQIKESIRSTGVQQPVHVTRRPDSNRYILAQGGNTRLQIVKELLAETGDNRFAVIPCIYIEYTSDTDIQIAHLIENEQRQEMCFWDKACAYGEIRDMFQAESERPLGLREMESLFLTHGLSLTHKTLALLFFARDHLSALAQAAQYLSNPKTIDIRKCHNQLRDTLKSSGEDGLFAAWWQDALAAYAEQHQDADDLDVPALSRYLGDRFAEAFGVDDAEDADDAPDESNKPSAASPVGEEEDEDVATTPADDADALSEHSGGHAWRWLNETNPQGGRDTPTVTPVSSLLPADEAEDYPKPRFACREDALKPLHRAVKKLLEAVRLPECFKACPHFGYGFYVEYPDFARIAKEPGHEQHYHIVDIRHPEAGDVWLMLSKISGQYEALCDAMMGADNPILKLPGDTRLYAAYYDPEVYSQYLETGIGERLYIVENMIRWQSSGNDPLHKVVCDMFAALKDVHDMDELTADGGA